MSLSASWVFLYTPIPWATILLVFLYRHDLSQLFHPIKDRSSVKDWKSMLQYLDIDLETSSLGKPRGKPGRVFLHKLRARISERYPNTRFYILVLAIVASSSLLSSLIGAALFLNLRFAVLAQVGLQFVSSSPSIFAMKSYFGPFPSGPHKYYLKRKRLGSLLRYGETLDRSSSHDN